MTKNKTTAYSTLAAMNLEPGKTLRITLRGDSMYPFLRDGDSLEIKKETDLHSGDIVVFILSRMLVAHRIVRIRGNRITAKGDAHKLSEEVDAESIAGKVVAVIRGSGRMRMDSFPAKLYAMLLPLSSLALRAHRKYFS